jgi:hypothetical protein
MRRVIVVPAICALLLTGSRGAAAAQAGIIVEVACRAAPETVRIVNSTGAAVTVRSVGSLVNPRPGVEPFARDDTVRPNDIIVYAFGPNPGAHAGAMFLTNQSIFDNDSPGEGVEVVTSAGTARVLCSRGSGNVGQDQTRESGAGVPPATGGSGAAGGGPPTGAAAGPAVPPKAPPGQIPDRLGPPGPAPAGAPGKTTGELPRSGEGEPNLLGLAAIAGASLLALGLALRRDDRSSRCRLMK